MGAVNQDIPDEILNDFYNAARKKFGDKKGCKRSAMIEAIQDWTKKEKGVRK
jgi:hypothetical protein